MPNEADCTTLKKLIEDGADFADIAKQHSKCPSGREGGALGTFSPGQMVKEFDEVVLSCQSSQSIIANCYMAVKGLPILVKKKSQRSTSFSPLLNAALYIST